MLCKKCGVTIDNDSLYCKWCGAAQKRDKKKAMYRRPDGLFEKIIVIAGKRTAFRGKSEKEIQKKIIEFNVAKERGRLFRDVANEWEEAHFSTISYNTQKSYAAPLRRAIDHFGDIPVKNIKPSEVNSFIGLFARKGFAQKTVKNQLLVLNLIFSYSVVNGDIETSPAMHIETPKNLPKHKRELPSDDAISLIKNNFSIPFGMLAYFILYTGCRIGETLALQYRDIDMENNIVHITKSVYHKNNMPFVKEPKTDAGTRDILLLDILKNKLSHGAANDYVFPGENGMMTYSYLKHGWNAYCKQIGLYTTYENIDKNGHKHQRILPQITPHQLRHGFATILFEAGVSDKDAQELLGHSSIAVTKDIYTHIRKSHKDETARILNDYTENTQ